MHVHQVAGRISKVYRASLNERAEFEHGLAASIEHARDQTIAGVCAGLTDVGWVRTLFVFATLFTGGGPQ